MKKVSAAIITLNEEKHIGECLQSLERVADEIVVVDSFSQDHTEQICRKFTDKFYQIEWEGFRATKQRATDLATYDWILSLDADERLSSGLQQEIMEWKASSEEVFMGFEIPRLTHFMGRWIQHTSWYPDRQLRLFNRQYAGWGGGRVHEAVRVDGATGRLSQPLLHYTYPSISEYLRKLDRFSSLAAADAFEQGRHSSIFHLSLYPPFVFVQNYLFKLGFLDGFPGFVVSVLASVSTFFKQLKLYELQQGRNSREGSDDFAHFG